MSDGPMAAPAKTGGQAWLLAWLLAGLLLVHLPAFLCLPPDNDVVLWDVCTKEVFAGRVLYRDVCENNLPGMLWWQAAVRGLLGWRSEAIRLADVVVVGVCIWLLVRWLPADASSGAKLGLALVLAAFYLGTSEWCHAQRDVWMLLPVLLAVGCRARRVETQPLPPGPPPLRGEGGERAPGALLGVSRSGSPSPRRGGGWGEGFCLPVVEGLLWGAAVWIKPFILVAALACWLASAVLIVRGGSWRRLLADAAGLLIGGLLAGAAGLAWLARSGAWADFWDILLVWNREYARFDYTEGERGLVLAGVAVRFFPWTVAQLLAIPLGLAWLSRLARARQEQGDGRLALLAALYLGWLGQVVFLQHHWDYLHVSPLLLALTLLGAEAVRAAPGRRAALVTFLAACVLLRLLPLTIDRLPVYARCWSEGSTPSLRDRLSLLHKVDWEALEQVRAFLHQEGVADGELSCLNMGCLSLHLDPGGRPATRFAVVQNPLVVFAGQRRRILAELAASRQRFLVVDAHRAAWKDKEPPPLDSRVLFAAGPYRVYAIRGDEMAAWCQHHLELP